MASLSSCFRSKNISEKRDVNKLASNGEDENLNGEVVQARELRAELP